MAYKGKYKPKNLSKYVGDPNKVRFLSLWERNLMIWLDKNDDIVEWGSEVVTIPYICGTDGKRHNYIIDFYIKDISGKKILVEVKPYKQTIPPKKTTKSKNPSNKYLLESMIYCKNISKWKAAKKFADYNGIGFEVWSENELRNIGIHIF